MRVQDETKERLRLERPLPPAFFRLVYGSCAQQWHLL